MSEDSKAKLPTSTKPETRSPQHSLQNLESTVQNYEKLLEPTTHEVIGNILGALSTGLGVEAPSIEAMRHFYMPELSKYPKDIIEEAANEILRSYVYPRFPPIAEFCRRADEMLLERRNLAREWRRDLEWERNGPIIEKQISGPQNGPKQISASLPKINRG